MPQPVFVLLIVLGAVAAAALLLFALYLFFLIRPRGKMPEDRSLLCDYAHRGLHSGEVPENSLLAFNRACEAGCGFELDVQLSRDGEVMVFHDYSLRRMTGCNRLLKNLTLEELKKLHLADTDERIPTFAEVLEAVAGRVPILIELKGENLDTSLVPPVVEHLKNYKGRYVIESFNPVLLRAIKKQLPDAYCGLLYTNVIRDKPRLSVGNILVTLMPFNFVWRPSFIAYNQLDRKTVPVTLATKFYRTPAFSFTIRNREQFDAAHRHGECAIFERLDCE